MREATVGGERSMEGGEKKKYALYWKDHDGEPAPKSS